MKCLTDLKNIINMKKTIRLTESDLINIVKRVVKEQQLSEDTFTFGDKVRNKLGKLVGLPERTKNDEKLADDILSKVESGEYEVLEGYDNYRIPKGYKISLSLDGEEYIVKVSKTRKGVIEGGALSTSTQVTKPDGEKINIPGKGFAEKIMRLVDESGKFKFPDEKPRTKFRPKVGSAMY
jgi:hypothetical protein